MNEFKGIENIFLVGAGGIGMSALVRYFLSGGFYVAGYDRTETELTGQLVSEGCSMLYDNTTESIPERCQNSASTIVIYTPAIPKSSPLLDYFERGGFRIYKRAEVLGMISRNSTTLAIAGTHGKTSITTLTAHLLKQSAVDCTAFLGGISKNYNTNLLIGTGNITVIEADEFDRSFHYLRPYLALITAIDPDHLEVYGNYDNMAEAYNHFASLISDGGSLLVNSKIRGKIRNKVAIPIHTYGLESDSDFRVDKLRNIDGTYHFNIITPFGEIENLVLLVPGRMNLENSVGAIALASLAGVSDDEIRRALVYYKGVKRRFDIRVDKNGITYIDDYAHHPDELNYLITTLREFYAGREITVVFQPHLFSRTSEHAAAFALSLDRVDRIVMLPVYPAREEPVEGVTAAYTDKMQNSNRVLITKEEVVGYLKNLSHDVLLTIGAGDIDTLVKPIEKMLIKSIR